MGYDTVMTNDREEEKKSLNKSEYQINKGFETMLTHISGGKKKSKSLRWNFSIFGRKIYIEITVNNKHT